MKRVKMPKPAKVEQDAHAEELADAVTGRVVFKKPSAWGKTRQLLVDLKTSERHVLRARGDLAPQGKTLLAEIADIESAELKAEKKKGGKP